MILDVVAKVGIIVQVKTKLEVKLEGLASSSGLLREGNRCGRDP